MRAVELIRKKRDGGELTSAEIVSLVQGFTSGAIPDYQMAAWLMAALCRGLSTAETAALTEAMLRSGQTFDLSTLPGLKVDKHSTGGVGDKTSLILAPIVAAGGVTVPMISGRGLGHTGGTLDKLESIPGFNVNLSPPQFLEILRHCGFSMIGQTAEIVPADKKMYALRDASGTVESPSLICASIMSKKLAEGIDALVLDVKTGSGAFMKTQPAAERLAEMMVDTGERMGKRVVALITDMDQPLGRLAGNSLEVIECLEILRGVRHPMSEDLRSLSLELSAWMFYLGKRTATVDAGRQLAEELITNGHALARFREMTRRQGGDVGIIDNPSRLPVARCQSDFTAARAGFITAINCEQVGLACLALGGGRNKQDDVINPAVGLEFHKKTGDPIQLHEKIATLHSNDAARAAEATRLLTEAYQIGEKRTSPPRTLIKKIINRMPV